MSGKEREGYELLDSGSGRKLERFGQFLIARPCAAAVWKERLASSAWLGADAAFDREEGNRWSFRRKLPDTWDVTVDGMIFRLSATGFGHLGVFPEHRKIWSIIRAAAGAGAGRGGEPVPVLNLFGYSGGASLAAADAGAAVCHLDASRGMVERARENARLNGLDGRPIRWIVDDAGKFITREVKRGSRYRGIVLDPPSFGRGRSGEVFKIEENLPVLLERCVSLLSEDALFLAVSCHTAFFTPMVLENLLRQSAGRFGGGSVISGELALEGGKNVVKVPSGAFAAWLAKGVDMRKPGELQ